MSQNGCVLLIPPIGRCMLSEWLIMGDDHLITLGDACQLPPLKVPCSPLPCSIWLGESHQVQPIFKLHVLEGRVSENLWTYGYSRNSNR